MVDQIVDHMVEIPIRSTLRPTIQMMEKQLKLFGHPLTISLRNDGDMAVLNEVLVNREYRLCDEVIQKAQKAIVDIGGHAGYFALYAACLNAKVPIYSFEPHPGNYDLLKENLKQNKVKNVFPKNLAVSQEEGQAELKASQEDLNHSLVHAIEATGETFKVNTTTLEKILKKLEGGQVDLLKMDCEGAEFSILENTPSSIFDKVSTIILEYHDWVPGGDHHRLKVFLEKQGYRVKDLPNAKMKELGFLWCQK